MESQLVFVGPTRETQGLIHYGQIFVDGNFSPAIQSLLAAKPILKSFFYPIAQYGEGKRLAAAHVNVFKTAKAVGRTLGRPPGRPIGRRH